MTEYRIWWSPVGHENGSAVVAADDERQARSMALSEMTKRNAIGAYGAEPVGTKEDSA